MTTTVKIPIKKSGNLTKFGYGMKMAAGVRHAALLGAVRAHGWNPVIWKLNALSILNKNRNPKASEIFRRDMRWVQRMRRVTFSYSSSSYPTTTATATKRRLPSGTYSK